METKLILALILGFGIGVWFQYLNVCFWKYYAQKKNKCNDLQKNDV